MPAPKKKKRKLNFNSPVRPGIATLFLNEHYANVPAFVEDIKNGHILYLFINNDRNLNHTEKVLRTVLNCAPVTQYTIQKLVSNILEKYKKLTDEKELNRFKDACNEKAVIFFLPVHEGMDKGQEVSQPVVLKGQIDGWPARVWTPNSLAECLPEMKLQFRAGPKQPYKDVIWEGDCSYTEANVQDFVEWTCNQETSGDNPLSKYENEKCWLYADYKYMATQFKDKPSLIRAVDWSGFGLEGRDGTQSTFWLGSEGAHTPCHQDSYGCNLVAQIYGRKRWILFPPSDRGCLYPTRIPYEESSVFSHVNVAMPDLLKHPKFQDAHPYVVTLEPGDVLYVPHHWWHFVESLETSISVNTWLELPCDHEMRVQEAMTRTVLCSLMTSHQPVDTAWLNPTEELTTSDQNLQYVNQATRTFMQIMKDQECTVSSEKVATKGGDKRDTGVLDSAQCSKCAYKDCSCCEGEHTGPCKKKKKSSSTSQKIYEEDTSRAKNDCQLDHQVCVKISCHKANSHLTINVTLKDDCSLKNVIVPVPSCSVQDLVAQFKKLPRSKHSSKLNSNAHEKDLQSTHEIVVKGLKSASSAFSNVAIEQIAECFAHPDVIECATNILLNKLKT